MANLSFSITVPDNKLNEIIEYFVKNQGYQDTLLIDGQTIQNPETRTQAARRFILEYVKGHYKAYKVRVDTNSAKDSAITYAEGVSFT